MNKLVKLPLFLGCVGAICGGILALTNAFTADKIAADEQQRIEDAYKEHFAAFTTENSKTETLSSTLSNAGVTEKLLAFTTDHDFLGTIYTCAATGYAGKSSPINFSVSFNADGTYNKYVSLGNSESSAGAKFMSTLNNGTVTIQEVAESDATKMSGSSVSYKAVKTAVNACYDDFIAEYKNIKWEA